MLIAIIIIAFIAIVIVCVVKASMDTGNYQTFIENKISKDGIKVSKRVQINNLYREVLIDENKKKFILTLQDSIKTYNFADIIDFDLQEDGNVISKGKSVATAIGGLAFGTVGALVGSAGKQKHESTCSSLVLRIRINNVQNPQIVINFITNETKKDSIIYKVSKKNAEELVSVLSYIQSQNSQAEQISSPQIEEIVSPEPIQKDSINFSNNSDIIETIKKLSELKDKGLITEEEFNTKKSELLAKL